MRFSAALAVFSLFAASASASVTPLLRRQSPPACELPCVTNPNLGGCKAGDNTCLCNNDVFVQSTFQCIQAACTGQDLHDAIAGAAALCAAVHVTLVSAAGAEFSATASLALRRCDHSCVQHRRRHISSRFPLSHHQRRALIVRQRAPRPRSHRRRRACSLSSH
ncbi:hypothetical protein B0H13DRAFT_2077788 [Mycena leptocephala]|nr:hypothetical protein B0H13DRAFT_2077788 [Mycena leptocephala]